MCVCVCNVYVYKVMNNMYCDKNHTVILLFAIRARHLTNVYSCIPLHHIICIRNAHNR